MLAFRFTAVSDEKREGLIWLGFNLGTGAVVSDILARLRPALAQMADWHVPEPAMRRAAGPRMERGDARSAAASAARPCRCATALEPFLRAMRRRLERDRNRVHAYHDDLRGASLKRLAALGRRAGRTGARPTGGARRCGSRRSSANTAPSSTTCAATTPCASRSNGCRRWTSMCRCSASRC